MSNNATYAKVIVTGSPISKSNFKLFNINGRAILPMNSGKYHDRYAIYEEEIALEARRQNPDVVLSEGLIAVLKVYYKNKKRHPDTNNIPKSIFDGIEKSGLIINDAQIKSLFIEEFYDKENPRFELELFGESEYSISYEVSRRTTPQSPERYNPPPNRKKSINDIRDLNTVSEMVNHTNAKNLKALGAKKTDTKTQNKVEDSLNKKTIDAVKDKEFSLYKTSCNICGKSLNKNNTISANKGSLLICKDCFKNLF